MVMFFVMIRARYPFVRVKPIFRVRLAAVFGNQARQFPDIRPAACLLSRSSGLSPV